MGSLAIVPLVALAWTAAFPAPDPFGGPPPGLLDVAQQAGLVGLLVRSVVLALGVSAWVVPLGTALAWAEHRLVFPLRRLLTLTTLLPLAMPSYVLAASVARGLGPSGMLPLFERVSGLPAAVLVIGVVTVPYVQLVVGSALVNGSAAEEEAARALGASPWRVFVDVVLPRIRPALATSMLLAMLYALSDFGAVAVLDTPVLTWRLYQAVAGQELARAAVLGGALLGATVPLFIASRALQGRRTASQVANPRPPARRRASPVEALVVGGTALVVVGLGVVFPVLSLVSWTIEGLREGATFAPLWKPVTHTLFAAAVGTVVTTVLAAVPAVVVGARRRSGALDPVTYGTSALPGVLLAFGWILAALGLARALPGTGWYAAWLSSGALLFIGYATRYLAEAYTPMKTTVWRFDRRLLQAHRALGGSPSRFVFRVALPELAPGLAAGALLAFLAILKELPVTLLLGSATGLTTLAFRVWDRSSEALWHDAGAAGLCLLALATLGVLASLSWRRRA